MSVLMAHILPNDEVRVNLNNVYKVREKGYTNGDGLFWAFDHLPQVPCTGACVTGPLSRNGQLCVDMADPVCDMCGAKKGESHQTWCPWRPR